MHSTEHDALWYKQACSAWEQSTEGWWCCLQVCLHLLCSPTPPWPVVAMDCICAAFIVADLSWLQVPVTDSVTGLQAVSAATLAASRAGKMAAALRTLQYGRAVRAVVAAGQALLRRERVVHSQVGGDMHCCRQIGAATLQLVRCLPAQAGRHACWGGFWQPLPLCGCRPGRDMASQHGSWAPRMGNESISAGHRAGLCPHVIGCRLQA